MRFYYYFISGSSIDLFFTNYIFPRNLVNDWIKENDWALGFKSSLLKGNDEDGIRTHACRAHWISSPTP